MTRARASEETPARPGSPRPGMRGVTWRSVGVGLALIPANTYWLTQIEVVRTGGYPTTASLFYNCITWLLVLLALNAPLRRFAPSKALSHAELLVVYTILSVSSAAGGLDFTQVLVPEISHPHYHARPENRWDELILPYLPSWLFVKGDAGAAIWQGGHSIREPAMYQAWLGPAAWWVAFITALFVMCLGVNLIFRQRWVASERLMFPIVQLPLEMASPKTGLYKDPVFRIGFGMAAFVELLNGLHFIYPTFPALHTRAGAIPNYNLAAQLTDAPWNAVGFWPVSFYPFIIGLGMLLPSELSFSCWFFFVLFKFERVFAAWRGVTVPGAPWVIEQSFGGFLGLSLFVLFVGRRYLATTVGMALGRVQGRTSGDLGSPGTYRLAYLMVIGGFVALVAFSLRAGATLAYAVAFFAIYLLLSLAVTRIRAEMGLPVHDLHFSGPHQSMERVLGSRALGERNVAVGSTYYWFNRAYRSHFMPQAAEGFKLADATRGGQWGLGSVMTAAMALGAAASILMQVSAFLRLGAGAGTWGYPFKGGEPWQDMALKMASPTSPSAHSAIASVAGILVTFFGMMVATRVTGWPIHPVGFAVSSSWSMERMYFPLFIAWSVKTTVIRYGGPGMYLRAIALAFGLILGDFTMGSLWDIYGIVRNKAVYTFFD